MIRPSTQAAAEVCGHVATLAEQFPETNDYIVHGNDVDGQAGRELEGGPKATHEDARACVTVARELLGEGGWKLLIQRSVTLRDPDTGQVLTVGTPDMQAVAKHALITFDWKKREQWFNGYLSGPDENLQTHTYSIARCLEMGISTYRNVLVLFGDGKAEAKVSAEFRQDDWWPWIERIRAVQKRDRTPHVGAHCHGCWHRWHCKNYREKAQMALALLPQGTGEIGPLTDEQAGLIADRAKAVKAALEVAMDLVKAHHHAGGKVVSGGKRYVPTMMPGKRTADVELLKKEGLTRFIKQGAEYERWIWKNEGGSK